ncbi:toll/interleukin-1 receptor domain-containing protein [Mesorhizobium amorphae]|uniref:TIR domain-containing protein n=1 Tax=Mesorhizobium amorphae CCNWGS0123 TaxID=1082933 RepID=G6YCD6_9HYPH|nr:toll/interleukin-1 receptor domain-containing protein [Mesorhizobium amorphae]ANT53527.1 hypothetical protein A6B35_28450 [Mesorhizobium amorphae CCNWGS0123]EHH10615.1 hypothetical protein MEA186_18088 [Mesorhizobium amorphae CCNWGS0123]GLR41457.1 hypothetical protein GCM10007880_19730 [Mesorhizobium amorphae]
MKIFASWSGEQSRLVAGALKAWLPNVLQAADVFMSSHDIASGDRGLNALASNLSERGFGIVVLTETNFKAPWVLFEAGALSNTLPGRVAPILCDMPALALVQSPLNQFQHNKFDRSGILKLVKDINAASPTPIDEGRLSGAFEKWWPDLESEYRKIPVDKQAEPKANGPRAEEKDNIQAALAQIMIAQSQQSRAQNDLRAMLVKALNIDDAHFRFGSSGNPPLNLMALAEELTRQSGLQPSANDPASTDGSVPRSPIVEPRRAKF